MRPSPDHGLPRRRDPGFTLLEVLIAAMLVTTSLAATYSYMVSFPRWTAAMSDRVEVLREQRVAQTALKRDFQDNDKVEVVPGSPPTLRFTKNPGQFTDYQFLGSQLMRDPAGAVPIHPLANHVVAFGITEGGPNEIDICLVFQKRRFRRRCVITTREIK